MSNSELTIKKARRILAAIFIAYLMLLAAGIAIAILCRGISEGFVLSLLLLAVFSSFIAKAIRFLDPDPSHKWGPYDTKLEYRIGGHRYKLMEACKHLAPEQKELMTTVLFKSFNRIIDELKEAGISVADKLTLNLADPEDQN